MNTDEDEGSVIHPQLNRNARSTHPGFLGGSSQNNPFNLFPNFNDLDISKHSIQYRNLRIFNDLSDGEDNEAVDVTNDLERLFLSSTMNQENQNLLNFRPHSHHHEFQHNESQNLMLD